MNDQDTNKTKNKKKTQRNSASQALLLFSCTMILFSCTTISSLAQYLLFLSHSSAGTNVRSGEIFTILLTLHLHFQIVVNSDCASEEEAQAIQFKLKSQKCLPNFNHFLNK